MGCDIHIIVEIKKNGKCVYVEDAPAIFNSRYYGIFSMLNKNVRNYAGRQGFEGKGLPSDISGYQYGFISRRKELETAYNLRTQFCLAEDGSRISLYDGRMRVEISEEQYYHLCEEMSEEESQRYFLPTHSRVQNKYFVQDAQQLNAKFVYKNNSEIFSTIDEFNNAHYKIPWVEAEQDYGHYDVDFPEEGRLHNHSHLTLADLKTKVIENVADTQFIVPKDFILLLQNEMGELPETFFIEETETDNVKVSYVEDPTSTNIQNDYNEGVKELEEIKNKYNVVSDEDIRIVFAFDS